MATLFDVNVPAISKHLKKIFESGELDTDSVVYKMEITASDGKHYQAQFYSLDAIIAVGYRVNSVGTANCLHTTVTLGSVTSYRLNSEMPAHNCDAWKRHLLQIELSP